LVEGASSEGSACVLARVESEERPKRKNIRSGNIRTNLGREKADISNGSPVRGSRKDKQGFQTLKGGGHEIRKRSLQGTTAALVVPT